MLPYVSLLYRARDVVRSQNTNSFRSFMESSKDPVVVVSRVLSQPREISIHCELCITRTRTWKVSKGNARHRVPEQGRAVILLRSLRASTLRKLHCKTSVPKSQSTRNVFQCEIWRPTQRALTVISNPYKDTSGPCSSAWFMEGPCVKGCFALLLEVPERPRSSWITVTTFFSVCPYASMCI